jgi:hypothetical protein
MDRIWTRVKYAVIAFFSILFKGRLPTELIVQPAAKAPPDTNSGSDRAVQILALLQRDGRLVDFLMEDLESYSDAQIGAAVRDIHAGCRQALQRYMRLESILAGQEGQPVTVTPGTDPAAVRLVGHVTGRPPFQGTLLHRGWRAAQVDLPPLTDGAARKVVAQAEVEVQ